MNRMNDIERLIIKILYKSHNKLDAYILFKRSKLNYKIFIKNLTILLEKKYIEENDEILKLTKIAISSISTNIVFGDIIPKWKEIPQKYRISKISSDEIYIPSLSLIDKKTFNI